MKPEQVTQVNPLIPDGIEKFVPSCVVCRQPVPAIRRTGRSKDTCSPQCNKVLRKYREFCLRNTRCRSCYHPSTPAERLDFIAWRKTRGDLREGRGRPKQSQEGVLRKALAEAIQLLESSDSEIQESMAIARFKKLVDIKTAE